MRDGAKTVSFSSGTILFLYDDHVTKPEDHYSYCLQLQTFVGFELMALSQAAEWIFIQLSFLHHLQPVPHDQSSHAVRHNVRAEMYSSSVPAPNLPLDLMKVWCYSSFLQSLKVCFQTSHMLHVSLPSFHSSLPESTWRLIVMTCFIFYFLFYFERSYVLIKVTFTSCVFPPC